MMDEPQNPNKPPERVIELSPHVWLLLRLIIACIFGAVIIFCSLEAAYDNAQHSFLFSWQLRTKSIVKLVSIEIEEYRQEHNSLPKTLDLLRDGRDLDAWERPLVYTIQGNSYTLVSYGQDGKPGGSGWDMDIGLTTPLSKDLKLNYHQFSNAPDAQGAIRTAWITGALAAFLCLIIVRPRPLTRSIILGLVVRIGVVLFAAVVVGDIIMIFHIPTGH